MEVFQFASNRRHALLEAFKLASHLIDVGTQGLVFDPEFAELADAQARDVRELVFPEVNAPLEHPAAKARGFQRCASCIFRGTSLLFLSSGARRGFQLRRSKLPLGAVTETAARRGGEALCTGGSQASPMLIRCAPCGHRTATVGDRFKGAVADVIVAGSVDFLFVDRL